MITYEGLPQPLHPIIWDFSDAGPNITRRAGDGTTIYESWDRTTNRVRVEHQDPSGHITLEMTTKPGAADAVFNAYCTAITTGAPTTPAPSRWRLVQPVGSVICPPPPYVFQ